MEFNLAQKNAPDMDVKKLVDDMTNKLEAETLDFMGRVIGDIVDYLGIKDNEQRQVVAGRITKDVVAKLYIKICLPPKPETDVVDDQDKAPETEEAKQ